MTKFRRPTETRISIRDDRLKVVDKSTGKSIDSEAFVRTINFSPSPYVAPDDRYEALGKLPTVEVAEVSQGMVVTTDGEFQSVQVRLTSDYKPHQHRNGDFGVSNYCSRFRAKDLKDLLGR